MTHLNCLRNFVIYEENVHEASQSLHRIQQIINSYGSLDELVKPVEFSPSKLVEMKFGEAYRQMTWLDVFIHLLRYFNEEERIAEQCSSILSRCASEFKGKMTRKGCF